MQLISSSFSTFACIACIACIACFDSTAVRHIVPLVQSNASALQFVDTTYLVEELFLSINLITYDMCKLAVQKDALTLQYVPCKFQSEEIINIAFQSNYRTLKYIHKDIMTDEIIDLAFQYKTNSVKK